MAAGNPLQSSIPGVKYRLRYDAKPPVPYAGLRAWGPSLTLWGAASGAAAFLILSVTPKIRNEVLQKVPGPFGDYFTDHVPDCDKPF